MDQHQSCIHAINDLYTMEKELVAQMEIEARRLGKIRALDAWLKADPINFTMVKSYKELFD